MIIAHPERYKAIQEDPSLAEGLLRMGCKLQASADFIEGAGWVASAVRSCTFDLQPVHPTSQVTRTSPALRAAGASEADVSDAREARRFLGCGRLPCGCRGEKRIMLNCSFADI